MSYIAGERFGIDNFINAFKILTIYRRMLMHTCSSTNNVYAGNIDAK